MMSFVEAIARMEGFYKQGSRPQRNNNPGDLEFHPWMTAYGGRLEGGKNPRFAVFPSAAEGFAALSRLFTFPAYRGKTIEQQLNTFAPPVENDTNNYVALVCEWSGCSPTDKVTNYTV